MGLNLVHSFTTSVYTNQPTDASLIDAKTYPDGTILMSLTYTDPLKEGIFTIQLIHPNGSVTAFDLTLRHKITYPLGSNYLFVVHEAADETTYGVVVDWNGKIISSNIPLKVTDDVSTSTFMSNIDPDVNFLWTYRDANQIHWILFSVPDANGTVNPISQGTFSAPTSTVLEGYKTFPTIEGGFGLAYLTRIPQLDSETPLYLSSKPQWFIHVTFLQPGFADFSEPSLIYQTSLPFPSFRLDYCFAATDGSGYGCMYDTPTRNGYDYMIISFLSSGSVSVVERTVDGNATKTEEVLELAPLPYSGFLIITLGDTFFGHVVYNNGTIERTMRIPTQTIHFSISPNNTFFLITHNDTDLILYAEPLPKFLQDDNGFGNLLIDSVEPPLRSIINSDIQKNITITFRKEIVLSFKNISIYQDAKDPILRQTFTAQSQYCSLLSDNKTVLFQVLSSTFNSPSSPYYIIMENDFVSSKAQSQPFSGVSKGYWTYTADISTGIFTETSTGILRLTSEGTTFFKNLDKGGKDNFFNEILRELSEVIPIDIKRLSTSKRHQSDPRAIDQIKFPITIQSANDISERTVHQVINDLDTLVKNKGITPISFKRLTSYLDSTHGFRPTPNLWENYKSTLIYVAIGIIILGVIYFFAWWKNRKARNYMIIKMTLILIDLSIDIAFVITNGKNVGWLFLPSILFLAISIAFNSLMAFVLLISEISTNKKFYEWFQIHSKLASFLTMIAATDVEAITLMSSELFGLEIFSAPFSTRAELWIFWAGFCNLFIKDAPQLIIQILYAQFTISYDIIPLLALIMGSIILANNVIDHIYVGIYKCRGQHNYKS